jgi:hypothetical protein
MRYPLVALVAVAVLTSACAKPPETSVSVDRAEAQDCVALQGVMEKAEAETATAETVHGAASAVSIAASVLSFVPGVGIAALAVKGAAKAAKLAGKDAERAPAEAHAESLARWEEMGCAEEEA